MKKAIGFILLQFISLTAAVAQTAIDFEDDMNDSTAAPIDDYIGVGIVVAILLTILVVKLKLMKSKLNSN